MISTNHSDTAPTSRPFLNENESMTLSEIRLDTLKESDADAVSLIIRQNLEGFDEHGTVLASTFRRLTDMFGIYNQEGYKLLVAKDMNQGGRCIGCVGLGSLHGLPVSEGVAEIRDLVVEPDFRGLGIGRKLLERSLDEVNSLGYQRVYLETTPQMKHAQKLFIRNGFRAVTEGSQAPADDSVPCYFVKEFTTN
jgi:ribosomal protein S18 acetylase RimI-like enzyme